MMGREEVGSAIGGLTNDCSGGRGWVAGREDRHQDSPKLHSILVVDVVGPLDTHRQLLQLRGRVCINFEEPFL